MYTLEQQLAGHSLADALAQIESDIKARPADADLRAAFVQLLCLAGNWTRAATQLKSWLALKPAAQPTVTLLEQAITGELQREAVMTGAAAPDMPVAQWPWLQEMASALTAEAADAAVLRNTALDSAEANPGTLTGQNQDSREFDWLMDGDARLGPVCELIVNGKYCWLPFSAIEEMRFQAPEGAIDLVWRHTLVRLVDGSEQVCQIPARYPLEPGAADRFLLGRATEWQALDEEGIHYQGQGQKVWLNADGEFPLLTLETLTFHGGDDSDE